MSEERRNLTHAQVQKFYDEVYYRHAGAASTFSGHHRRLARRLGIRVGQKVLDVACGAGDWLLAAQEQGAQVAGIDLSPKAISLCRARLPDGVFHAGPAERLPFTDGEFDLVTCLGSLEHFLDPRSALQEMRRVARADARFVLLVPNTGFLTHRLGLYHGTCQSSVIERARDLEEWSNLFESAGLRVTARWRDLHVISWAWINRGRWYRVPFRAMQALLLAVWPLSWQYQVYHLCVNSDIHRRSVS